MRIDSKITRDELTLSLSFGVDLNIFWFKFMVHLVAASQISWMLTDWLCDMPSSSKRTKLVKNSCFTLFFTFSSLPEVCEVCVAEPSDFS